MRGFAGTHDQDVAYWQPNGHGRMSDLSPLSGEQRKSNFGAARSVDDHP